jgi:Uma2 family endonuclease
MTAERTGEAIMTAERTGDTWDAESPPLTAEHVGRPPHDGRRRELLGGTLMVRPQPGPLHQMVAARLGGILLASCPAGMTVLPEAAIQFSRSTVLTADLAVARRQPPGFCPLTEPPLLAAEIHPPSASPGGLDRRRAAYAAFGVRSYWVLVLDAHWPELSVFELAGGHYERLARAVGGEVLRAKQPFCTEVVPARLIAGLHPPRLPRDDIGVTA